MNSKAALLCIYVFGFLLLVIISCKSEKEKEQKISYYSVPLENKASETISEKAKYICRNGAVAATYYDENLNYIRVDCSNFKEYYVEKSIVNGQEFWFLRNITQNWSKHGSNQVAMEITPLSSTNLEFEELIKMDLITGRFSLKKVDKNLWRLTGSKDRAKPYPFPVYLRKNKNK